MILDFVCEFRKSPRWRKFCSKVWWVIPENSFHRFWLTPQIFIEMLRAVRLDYLRHSRQKMRTKIGGLHEEMTSFATRGTEQVTSLPQGRRGAIENVHRKSIGLVAPLTHWQIWMGAIGVCVHVSVLWTPEHVRTFSTHNESSASTNVYSLKTFRLLTFFQFSY